MYMALKRRGAITPTSPSLEMAVAFLYLSRTLLFVSRPCLASKIAGVQSGVRTSEATTCSDRLLIAEIALRAENPSRAILLQFTKRTKDNTDIRTFTALFALLDAEFIRGRNGRALMRMQGFQVPKKLGGADIYTFWIRFNKLVADLSGSGTEMKSEMAFLNAIQSSDLTSRGRFSALSDMDDFPDKNFHRSLRIVTQWLLAHPLKMKQIHFESKESHGEHNEEMMLARHKTNRPGYEAAAVKGAQRQTNYPNADKGAKKNIK